MLCAQPWSTKYTHRSFNRELNPMSSLSFMADYREQKFSHLSLMESVMSLSVKYGWALRLFLAKRAWRKWLGVFLMRSCASLAASASVSQKTCSKNLESHIRSLSICTLRPPWWLWGAQATRRGCGGWDGRGVREAGWDTGFPRERWRRSPGERLRVKKVVVLGETKHYLEPQSARDQIKGETGPRTKKIPD